MPAAACPQPATAPAARAYRPRRPAATLLHELVRTNLETWLATAAERDEYGSGVPLHVAAALRNYPPVATPTSPTCGRVNFLHLAADGTGAF